MSLVETVHVGFVSELHIERGLGASLFLLALSPIAYSVLKSLL